MPGAHTLAAGWQLRQMTTAMADDPAAHDGAGMHSPRTWQGRTDHVPLVPFLAFPLKIVCSNDFRKQSGRKWFSLSPIPYTPRSFRVRE